MYLIHDLSEVIVTYTKFCSENISMIWMKEKTKHKETYIEFKYRLKNHQWSDPNNKIYLKDKLFKQLI